MTAEARMSGLRIARLGGLLLSLLLAWTPAWAEGTATKETESLAGMFLVAEHSMGDPRFAKTVVYMVRHDHQGAMGMVINRPLGELPLRELLRGPSGAPDDVGGSTLAHAGGPVEPQLGFVIHTAERLYPGSLRVGPRIAVTSQPEVLRAIGQGKPPRRHLLVLGYAGWAPGQLEAEMARDDWFTIGFDEDLLFDAEHGSKWDRALAMRSIEL